MAFRGVLLELISHADREMCTREMIGKHFVLLGKLDKNSALQQGIYSTPGIIYICWDTECYMCISHSVWS